MGRWFLSYTSQDYALMQALKVALQRLEPDSYIFFAPESMRAGGFWQQQLADEIAKSTAFALLVGENGIGSWQVLEYNEALDRRAKEPHYPLILILSGQTAKRMVPGLPFARQLHWILSENPASDATVGKLIAAASGPATRPDELWRYTRPYRGLEAMSEANSDFFYGREHETVEIVNTLASEHGRLPILLGNSGVGKSSLAQAGVLAALLRQGWAEHIEQPGPWPAVFTQSRHWCFLTLRPGNDPIKALLDLFLERWRFKAGAERMEEKNRLVALLGGRKATLSDLLDETETRYEELAQTVPPAFCLYIDQGEELYVRVDKEKRRRFSEIVSAGLGDPRVRMLMSLRADFFGELQKDESLYGVHHLISVPPLRAPELEHIVSKPAELLSAHFQTDTLAVDIARRAAEESTEDAGALPLLSYLLDDMWTEMVQRGDGVLRLPMPAVDLGGVLVERANKFIAAHPSPGANAAIRRILTLKLAAVREDGEPTRRRATRSEFTDEEWQLVSELADQPNRLLVTVTPEASMAPNAGSDLAESERVNQPLRETYAEVAHESIFRRWNRLREWIDTERQFLAWRNRLEIARRGWQDTPKRLKADALLRGFALKQARNWLASRQGDIPKTDLDFILRSKRKLLWKRLRMGTVAGVIVFAAATSAAWWQWSWLRERLYARLYAYPLSAQAERALTPKADFIECSDCPKMLVLPAGSITIGSLDSPDEQPPHEVTMDKQFAVAQYELTFAQWDACVNHGDCSPPISDGRWGHGQQPVINVSWNDAQRYVQWLKRITSKDYRLLTEAEWEYAARAGRSSYFSFGNDDAQLDQYAWYAANAERRPHPVGLKLPNKYGLYDMHGNVSEWVEDCYRDNYRDAAADGRAWTGGNCDYRVIRGGSWAYRQRVLRSSAREKSQFDKGNETIGIRVGRSLSP
jgi:formylglycine-generating enzyme required for sulfatase activity